MILLFYPEKSETGQHIRKIAESFAPVFQNIEIHHHMSGFSKRMHQSLESFSMIVLIPDTSADLDRLLAMQELFEGHDIILILPDKTQDTIAKGYRFFPRYAGFRHDDSSELMIIFAKMLEKHQHNNTSGANHEAAYSDH